MGKQTVDRSETALPHDAAPRNRCSHYIESMLTHTIRSTITANGRSPLATLEAVAEWLLIMEKFRCLDMSKAKLTRMNGSDI